MKLIIEDDDGRKTVVPFVRDEISIGRKAGNTIKLTERNVSRRHAVLKRGKGFVFVEDLGSFNGVRVNGGRIEGRAKIQEGDLIEIGDYNLAVQLEASDVTAAARQQTETTPPPVGGSASAKDDGEVNIEVDSRTERADRRAEESRGTTPQGAAAPRGGNGKARPPASTSSTSESTAVIKVDLETLNQAAEKKLLPQDRRPRLQALSPALSGESFEIAHTSVTLGRTPDNDIHLDHRSLSREHCRLFLDDEGTWKVLDLGSANGVRVNGEPYGLIHLRSADVIELGHVKLRFYAPGEDHVQEEDEDLDMAELAGIQRRRGKGPLIAIGGLVVAAAAGLGLWLTFGTPDETDPRRPAADEALAIDDTALRQAIQSAGDAAEREEWSEAVQAYKRALEIDEDNPTALQGLERVESEEAASRVHQEVMQAIGDKSWEAAWEGMNRIPDGSIYSERIAEHRREALEGYVGILVERAEQALDSESWGDSIAHASSALELLPGHDAASRVKARAEEGRSAALAEARTRRDREQLALRTKSTQEPAEQRPPEKQVAPPPPEPEAPKAEPTPARQPEPAAKQPTEEDPARSAFRTGRAHVQRNEFAEAIPHLQRAVELDSQSYSIAHALLGTCYARLGNPQRAAVHYRRFLAANPDHQQAPQVRRILEEFEGQFQ